MEPIHPYIIDKKKAHIIGFKHVKDPFAGVRYDSAGKRLLKCQVCPKWFVWGDDSEFYDGHRLFYEEVKA